jgi:hypothetical protein
MLSLELLMQDRQPDPAFRPLVLNALGFLRASYRSIWNGPNQAAINVYSAIELILKARLVFEHWSLMVSRDPDRARFESGDFVSVGFEDACTRLKRIVQDPVPEDAWQAFEALRKKRNRIVHFYTMDVLVTLNEKGERPDKETNREVMSAWGALHRLMRVTWSAHFSEFSEELDRIEQAIGVFRERS